MTRGLAPALVVLLLVSIVASACSSAAPAPASSTAPASTKPSASTSSAPSPSASASPQASKPAGTTASPAAGADKKAEWDKVVAAAKQEGKVVVAGGRAETYRTAVVPFQAAYPEIKLEFTGVAGSDFSPKIAAERGAGQFLWDVFMGGATTALTFKNKGYADPLKPALLLPEVLDDSKWVGGVDDGWMDKEHQFVYMFDGAVAYLAYVNRDVVKESELNSIEQLVDPKWKGKITTLDPRQTGGGSTGAATILMVKGEDWLRKYLSQDLVVTREARQQAEMVVRGQYPIGIRLSPGDMATFNQEGVAGSVKVLDPNGPAAAALAVGFGATLLVSQAPHPNAARVFLNWVFSKDGQAAYVKASNSNSRRIDLDVKGQAETAPNPKIKYPGVGKEENLATLNKAMSIAKEIIK